jgi:branched-chain amino acid transport system permease protein
LDIVTFLQQLVNGFANGMSYVLIAVGLTLVFGVLRLVNFAHGAFFMLGGYFAYYVISMTGLDYLLAVALAALLTGVAGMIANQFFFRPLRKEHEFTILLSSLGLGLLLTNGAELVFGADPKYVASEFSDETVSVGDIVVTQQRVLILVLALAALAFVYWFIRRTRYGKMMQATAQHAEGAMLTGIDTNFVHTYTFALASTLAGLSGALVGPTAMMFPTVGDWAVLKGFIVVVIGGLGSIVGACIGGTLLGVVEALGGGYVSQGFAEAIGYLLVAIVLIWRPQGLFDISRGSTK